MMEKNEFTTRTIFRITKKKHLSETLRETLFVYKTGCL